MIYNECDIKLGDKISVYQETCPEYTKSMVESKNPRTGKVVYINRKNRYFTVQYESGNKESFPFGVELNTKAFQ